VVQLYYFLDLAAGFLEGFFLAAEVFLATEVFLAFAGIALSDLEVA